MKWSARATTDPVVVKTAPAGGGVVLHRPRTTNPLGPEFEGISEESKIMSATHRKRCRWPLGETLHIQPDLTSRYGLIARNTVRTWNTNRHSVLEKLVRPCTGGCAKGHTRREFIIWSSLLIPIRVPIIVALFAKLCLVDGSIQEICVMRCG
jgi:hypothetical protein